MVLLPPMPRSEPGTWNVLNKHLLRQKWKLSSRTHRKMGLCIWCMIKLALQKGRQINTGVGTIGKPCARGWGGCGEDRDLSQACNLAPSWNATFKMHKPTRKRKREEGMTTEFLRVESKWTSTIRQRSQAGNKKKGKFNLIDTWIFKRLRNFGRGLKVRWRGSC